MVSDTLGSSHEQVSSDIALTTRWSSMRIFVQRIRESSAILAVVSVLVWGGIVGQAQAFSFGEGDLVLAIYGNSYEALYNLGNKNAILAPGGNGISINVSAGLSAAQYGLNPNPVKYTLFGWDISLPEGQIYAGTAAAPGSIPTSPLCLTCQLNQSVVMSAVWSFSGNVIASSDPRSFSSNLNLGGNSSFEGAWPVFMGGSLGQSINILLGDVQNNTFALAGSAILTSSGELIVGNPGPVAVPLLSGVILFGTGYVVLMAYARRAFHCQLK